MPFFPLWSMDFKKFLYMRQMLSMIYKCDMIFIQMNTFNRSHCSRDMTKSVTFILSTYNCGNTIKTFKNLKTPSCVAHQSCPRLVNNWKGHWKKCFFLLACVGEVYDAPLEITKILEFRYQFWALHFKTTFPRMYIKL